MAYQVTTTKKPLQPAQPTIAPVNPLVKQQVAETPPRSTPASANVGPAQQPAGPTSADLTPATTAPAKTPQQRLDEEIASGYANADKYGIGKAGSMGEIKDERKAEIDDLLAKQKAGLDGMTPEEMLAAKEQGNATINGQLATNMQQFADVAAGNGIRGGSAAGLQMQAMAGAQAESGQLARKMILDNVAQKNIAMDRYGKTLGEQQGVGIGIQDKNNQTRNAETLARELAAAGYTSLLDSYKSGDKADALSNRGIGILEDQVKNLGPKDATTAPGAAPTPVQPGQPVEPNNGSATASYATSETLQKARSGGAGYRFMNDANTPMTDAEIQEKIAQDPQGILAQEVYAASLGKTADQLTNEELTAFKNKFASKSQANANSCIITSEAIAQDLLDPQWSTITRRYKLTKMAREDIQVYWAWAERIVKLMQKSPRVARMIAKVLPGTLTAMAKELNLVDEAPLHGELFFGLYKALNAYYRPIVLKRNGQQMSPAAVERLYRMRAVN